MTKRVESITKSLDKLTLNELNELNQKLVDRLVAKETEDAKKNPKEYKSTKALEIAFSDITEGHGETNRITLAQFQQKLNSLISARIQI